jgi:hypothetical protein
MEEALKHLQRSKLAHLIPYSIYHLDLISMMLDLEVLHPSIFFKNLPIRREMQDLMDR